MESYRRSVALYKNLIGNQAANLRNVVGTPFHSQFDVNQSQKIYYRNLYINLVDNFNKNIPPSSPPNDQNCKNCETHFLQQPPEINHAEDIRIGRVFEDYFSDFLNEYFRVKNLHLNCSRADNIKKNMPDFKIVDLNSGIDIFYFEFKCIFKPFIRVSRNIKGAQCYNQSLTLDCDSKLTKQKQLIYSGDILEKTAYVYWYDIPCVKGVFWQFSKDVFEYEESAGTYKRKTKLGDYDEKGIKVGHIDKIYLSLQNMYNFDSLLQHIIKINR